MGPVAFVAIDTVYGIDTRPGPTEKEVRMILKNQAICETKALNFKSKIIDRAPQPQYQQERYLTAIPAVDASAHPLALAVELAQRPNDGRGPD